jgi:hypothetical protein
MFYHGVCHHNAKECRCNLRLLNHVTQLYRQYFSVLHRTVKNKSETLERNILLISNLWNKVISELISNIFSGKITNLFYMPRYTNRLTVMFFFQMTCGNNTCIVRNNLLPEERYQRYAVVNKTANPKDGITSIGLCASASRPPFTFFEGATPLDRTDNVHVHVR